ncbi:outer membrane protein assembly factor BamE domain-containing protein [Chromobacterium haemolyticum]|uniref:outer membrane protein assembly factor BamE domain-containing protein n=1 Tax=Chromobacterium haemolyticum TaxID=394935 RepID=UPI0024481004|nr:outer membrane protein assembly factor BamE [Chromobacterium haemolyticum]MDH0342097.1 outer membrane protein assembly factor BamE [Chromobacterium haemolyticum]
MKKAISIVLIAASLGGCATNYGNASITDDKKVSAIQIGKSTTKDVQSTLGKPSYVSTEEGGEQVWLYQNVNVSGKAMIPFVALFGGTMKENNMSIRFNRKGVVKAVGNGEKVM